MSVLEEASSSREAPRLSDSAVSHFHEHGFVHLRDLLSDDLDECRGRVAAFLDQNTPDGRRFVRRGKGGRPVFVKVTQLAETEPSYQRLATHPVLVAIIEALIGPVELFRDVLVVKPAGVGSVVRFHQDTAYWDVESEATVSAWICLEDVPEESGCLRVIPGSHRTPARHDIYVGKRRLPRRLTELLRRSVSLTGTGDNPKSFIQRLFHKTKQAVLGGGTRLMPWLNDLNELQVDPRVYSLERSETIPTRVGDVIFFHGQLLHASGENRGNADRHAYIASYAASRRADA